MPSATKAHVSAEDADMEDAAAPTSAQQPVDSQEGGDPMEEDGEDNGFGDEEAEEPQRVRILPGSTSTAASYEFLKEGHTLGNALRYIIMKKYVILRCYPSYCLMPIFMINPKISPDVEFCAYAIPHPSEDKMNLRIQTYGGNFY
jgi:DNA-directed RNA polymerase I and III subunit RPAC2